MSLDLEDQRLRPVPFDDQRLFQAWQLCPLARSLADALEADIDDCTADSKHRSRRPFGL
jgi:hypothetical protein